MDDAFAPGSPEWARAALDACLAQLPTDKIGLGKTVRVLRAWTEGGAAFCVVYRYPYFDGVLGLRRTFESDMYGETPSDPGDFGCDVAVYDIGEPLGTVADHLRVDRDGVHWWGSLEPSLPIQPIE